MAGESFEERKAKWWAWHKENPHVWALFERFALQAVERGVEETSAWLIVNRIRWETNIVTKSGDFKISNDFIAFYARLWRALYPEHAGLFRVKRMQGENVGETEDA